MNQGRNSSAVPNEPKTPFVPHKEHFGLISEQTPPAGGPRPEGEARGWDETEHFGLISEQTPPAGAPRPEGEAREWDERESISLTPPSPSPMGPGEAATDPDRERPSDTPPPQPAADNPVTEFAPYTPAPPSGIPPTEPAADTQLPEPADETPPPEHPGDFSHPDHLAGTSHSHSGDDVFHSDLHLSSGVRLKFDGSGPLKPGHVLFERYLVERQLGEGGMGTVWLVRHLEFDSERALKLIVSGIANDHQARARFKREARIMDRLNHPNAVRVYDARMGEDLAFIEMEYVRGKSLKELLVPGVTMPLTWVKDLLDQLCDVLQAANDEGIIHRDIKPPNLMLVEGREPGTKRLKLLDFGIAKIREVSDDVRTVTGNFMGTPLYSSPEQIIGEKVDSRSDLYSVGLILYELLTGQRPFGGSVNSLIYKHTMVAPPPFAELNPNADVPAEVERVVMKCLAKSPADRPQSPRELSAMFNYAIASTKTTLPPSPTPESQATPPKVTTPTWGLEETVGDPSWSEVHKTELAPPDPGGDTDFSVTPRPKPLPATPPSRLPALLYFVGITLTILVLALFSLLALRRPDLLPWRSPGDGGVILDGKKKPTPIDPEIKKWLEHWDGRGYHVVNNEGGTRPSWPNTLQMEDGLRFHRTLGGIYLPEGYKPGDDTDPVDGRPRTLTHENWGTFVRIAGGRFPMGCIDESIPAQDDPTRPAHPVSLSGFYMQTTEVTNGQMERYLEGVGSDVCPLWKNKFIKLKRYGLTDDQTRKHPAVGISWHIAAIYARKRGGWLPTEAQWEYAARSRGQDFLHVWDRNGSPKGALSQLANLNTNGATEWGTAEVGSFPDDLTAQGVYDMTGNVREWCRDVWKRYDPSTQQALDPQFPPDRSGHPEVKMVVRGGSYQSSPEAGQTTNRDDPRPRDEVTPELGFRIVIECPELPSAAR
jgi:serine/threonine protein kinase/formylglycine-generating enzyme required for sulfatase activity